MIRAFVVCIKKRLFILSFFLIAALASSGNLLSQTTSGGSPDNFSFLHFTYLPDSSAKPEPEGFKWKAYPAMEGDDPTAFIRGLPVYFNFHTGKTVHFTVDSTKPLTKLTYTGVAFKTFSIEIQDLSGKHITGAGPFTYGNMENTIEVPLPNISHFEVTVNDHSSSWILIEKMGFDVEGAPPEAATASVPLNSNSPNELPAPAGQLTEDQARAVVLIKGDNAEGTGFLVKMPDGPVVVTNIHVISNNPNLKITPNTGAPITILSYKGATDRDLAMIAIKDDGSFSYLTLATDISGTVQPGDEVITPGNSEGGEVMLNTSGKVLGIGPNRIEFDNPVYHGNSGGPVFHVKTGKVIGVVTEAIKVDTSDEIDKTSFASHRSAIHGAMRYFGLRVDTVPQWEPYDWNHLQSETMFLDQFDKQSRCLASYLIAVNSADKKPHKKKKAGNEDKDDPDANLYLTDEKIVKALRILNEQISGADTAQQLDAVTQFVSTLTDIADTDMAAIQNLGNFYTFDQQQAKDEIAYRKAIKTELNSMGDNVGWLDSLPRTNN